MGSLKPTHIEFTSPEGRGYAQLKPGTTWTQAKKTAAAFKTADGKPAGKAVRRT